MGNAKQITKREETTNLPNLRARGIVAAVYFKQRGGLFHAWERADGSFTKATRVPSDLVQQ